MSNTFGTDILIQAEDPMKAASFYVKELGFEITEKKPNLVSLHGKNINFVYRTRSCPWTRFGSYCQKCSESQSEPEGKRLRNNKGRT